MIEPSSAAASMDWYWRYGTAPLSAPVFSLFDTNSVKMLLNV